LNTLVEDNKDIKNQLNSCVFDLHEVQVKLGSNNMLFEEHENKLKNMTTEVIDRLNEEIQQLSKSCESTTLQMGKLSST
jgi:cob(I)alamin adenosyltransferase